MLRQMQNQMSLHSLLYNKISENHILKIITLDDIITEIVRQCVVKGIIKGTSVSIDATQSNDNKR